MDTTENKIQEIYLYGAGGHAKVVLDILSACGMRVPAIIDGNPALHELKGIPVTHEWAGMSPLIIAIGGNAVRKKIAEEVSAAFATAIHPSAVVSPCAEIGEGTVVMQNATVQADARIGRHCIVNTASSIDHECQLGDYVHVSPHATLCGNVRVGEGTWIGAGATVIQGINIGRWSVVGAGSVVTRDIPDGVIAVGIPAQIKKML